MDDEIPPPDNLKAYWKNQKGDSLVRHEEDFKNTVQSVRFNYPLCSGEFRIRLLRRSTEWIPYDATIELIESEINKILDNTNLSVTVSAVYLHFENTLEICLKRMEIYFHPVFHVTDTIRIELKGVQTHKSFKKAKIKYQVATRRMVKKIQVNEVTEWI